MEDAIKEFARNLKQTGTGVAFNFPGFYSSLLFDKFDNHIISTNESVAYASAWGASQVGQKSLVCFRDLGLNVAADAYINSLFTGVGAGLVAVVFSDSKFEGSQCIIDISNYARFGGIWLKPYDYNSLVLVSKIANLLSSSFDLPVIVEINNKFHFDKRNTTNVEAQLVRKIIEEYSIRSKKNIEPIAHPINAYEQSDVLYGKNKKLSEMADKINKFFNKDLIIIHRIARHEMLTPPSSDNYIVSTRYERVFKEIKKYFTYICGDVGEFTKDTLNTITHTLNFGSSIAMAMGMSLAGQKDIVAIVGDGAFFHSAKNSIDEVIARGLSIKILLIDNNGLYSTGGQKTFGMIPSYIKMTELDFSHGISEKAVQKTIKEFYSDPNIMLLKIKFKV